MQERMLMASMAVKACSKLAGNSVSIVKDDEMRQDEENRTV